MFIDYLKNVGLNDLISHIGDIKLNNIVGDAFEQTFPNLSAEEIKKLYVYDVPRMSADGLSCFIGEKADKPYNLTETFGLQSDWKALKNHPQTIRLWRLNKVVYEIYKLTKVDWLGIYRKRNNLKGKLVLVKEAYGGLFSRAEFPLTKVFARKSNNSAVGLTGKAVVIQDVNAYTGAYYECDNNVNSEFCLPILDKSNKLIGIIDAEAFAKNHYTKERLIQIAKVAYDLGQRNLGI